MSTVQKHWYWGIVATAADLPNVAGSPTQSAALNVGDQAYVSSSSLVYYCTNATLGAAVWQVFGQSGTYTPTVTPVTPGTLVAAVADTFMYQRVGSIVHVSGALGVTPASLAGNNQIDLSLPIAVMSLASLSGHCTGNSLPSTFDVLNVQGNVRNGGVAARAYFSLAINNAPSPFRLDVSFTYLLT